MKKKEAVIVQCKVCGESISSDAKVCPHCGAKVKKKIPAWRVVLGIFLAIIGIGIIGSALSGDGETKEVDDSTTVTMEEFEAVKPGMSYDDVVDIVGFDGTLMSQVDLGSFDIGDVEINSSTEIYSWSNKDGTNMIVIIQGDKVTAKSQTFLD